MSSLSRTVESCLLCLSACRGSSASAAAGDVSTVPLVYRYDICQTGGFKAHIWLEYHINLVSHGVSSLPLRDNVNFGNLIKTSKGGNLDIGCVELPNQSGIV